ncbi:eIF2 kinase Gcn2p negative regulator [Xylographa bjoerkii]|nr:eIF2 kinase Gcn2p negative regulator [Xylographa bjoerkii]
MDPSLNSTLADELLTINAIHPSALTHLSTSPDICALRLPAHSSISIRLSFPSSYPDDPPSVLGPQTSGGEGTRKGEGSRIAALVEETLTRVYQAGEPCVFALIDDIAEAVTQDGGESDGTVGTDGESAEFEHSGPFTAATAGSAAAGDSSKGEKGGVVEMYHALVRTHHITSRKKVAKLKHAADALGVNVLLRSGGSPGLMYVEGKEEGVKEWVAVVQVLIPSSMTSDNYKGNFV